MLLTCILPLGNEHCMCCVLGAVHVGVKVYCSFTVHAPPLLCTLLLYCARSSFTVHAPPLLCTLLLYCARSSLVTLQLKHLKQVPRGPSLPAWSFSAGVVLLCRRGPSLPAWSFSAGVFLLCRRVLVHCCHAALVVVLLLLQRHRVFIY